jgi:hypothetical protein
MRPLSRQPVTRGLRLPVLVALAVLLAACSVPRGVMVRHPPSPPPGSIDAFVPEAQRFVEVHRGLKFKSPVKVQHLSDQAFTDRIIQLQRRDHADLDKQAKVLRAVGLLKPGVDAEKAEEALLGSGVVGYYDSKTKELVVRGDSATQSVKHVVVHELTHAVQDQWFSLDSTGTGNNDADIAYTSLIEGDAVSIENEYLASLSSSDRQQLRSQESSAGGVPPDVPRVLIEELAFPYQVGPPFRQALLLARGQKGLDDAFKNRPATSSQVIHPDRFLGGDAPAAVDQPTPDGAEFDHGVIGEFGFRLLFENLLPTGAITLSQLQAATTGWTGDRYTAWADGDRYCVRDRLATPSPDAAAALKTVLDKFAASHPGVTVDPTPQPQFTSCG